MKREIIFRGKLCHSNSWVYGNLCKTTNGDSFILPIDVCEEDGHHFRVDSELPFAIDSDSIGQFTGLLDKNGQKIFEGDVIEHGNFYWQEGSSEDFFGTEPQNSWNVVEAYAERIKSKVVFSDCGFWLANIKNNKLFKSLNWLANYNWKIVDIFAEQHPEEHSESLKESGFDNSDEMKNYLKSFELMENIFDNPELVAKHD